MTSEFSCYIGMQSVRYHRCIQKPVKHLRQLFAKIVIGKKRFTIFVKTSILDVWQCLFVIAVFLQWVFKTFLFSNIYWGSGIPELENRVKKLSYGW